jgi:hypothetical protein
MIPLLLISLLQNKAQRTIKKFEAKEYTLLPGIPLPMTQSFVVAGENIKISIGLQDPKYAFGYVGKFTDVIAIVSNTKQKIKVYYLDESKGADLKVERHYLITKTSWNGDLSYDYSHGHDSERDLQTKFYIVNPNGFMVSSWFNSDELGLNVTDGDKNTEKTTMNSFFPSSIDGRTAVLLDMDIKKDVKLQVKGKRWVIVSGTADNTMPEKVLEITKDRGLLTEDTPDDDIADYSGILDTKLIFVLIACSFVLIIIIIVCLCCCCRKK